MPNVVTLDMNTPSVQYLCKKDKRLAKVISMVGSIAYVPYCDNPYAFLIHEITPYKSLRDKAFRYVRVQALTVCTPRGAEREVSPLSANKKISPLHTPRCEKGGISYVSNTP